MLDQYGKEIGGPSLEQRVKDLEEGFGEIVKAVVKLQQLTAVLLNVRSFDKGETTDGIQASNREQAPDEESASTSPED